ncbi:MAG: lysophospholipid acyltransferase family protein [Gammaproteobacteria bacterium]|nr:lysophospholipid acyltransferase family protein [Gammaproteobacteria bacterium]
MSKKAQLQMIKCFIFVGLLRISQLLPYSGRSMLASWIAKKRLEGKSKSVKTIQKNLQLCYPQITEAHVDSTTYEVLKSYAMLLLEMGIAWFGSKKKTIKLIHKVEGIEKLNKLYESKKPVIIAVPHIGNWEILWNYLQINFETTGMYSKDRNIYFDKIVTKARTRFGGMLYATDPRGLKGLLKSLKQGSVLMILPDRAPIKGSGSYSEIFGQSVYTMTLLHKILQKSGARLLFADCIRNKNKGFNIRIEDSNEIESITDMNKFNDKMNKKLELIINQNKEQYLWSYERFRKHAKTRKKETDSNLL